MRMKEAKTAKHDFFLVHCVSTNQATSSNNRCSSSNGGLDSEQEDVVKLNGIIDKLKKFLVFTFDNINWTKVYCQIMNMCWS